MPGSVITPKTMISSPSGTKKNFVPLNFLMDKYEKYFYSFYTILYALFIWPRKTYWPFPILLQMKVCLLISVLVHDIWSEPYDPLIHLLNQHTCRYGQRNNVFGIANCLMLWDIFPDFSSELIHDIRSWFPNKVAWITPWKLSSLI
jgi:hypothetical protein